MAHGETARLDYLLLFRHLWRTTLVTVRHNLTCNSSRNSVFVWALSTTLWCKWRVGEGENRVLHIESKQLRHWLARLNPLPCLVVLVLKNSFFGCQITAGKNCGRGKGKSPLCRTGDPGTNEKVTSSNSTDGGPCTTRAFASGASCSVPRMISHFAKRSSYT